MLTVEWVVGTFASIVLAGAGLYVRGIANTAKEAKELADQSAAMRHQMATDLAVVKGDVSHLRESVGRVEYELGSIKRALTGVG